MIKKTTANNRTETEKERESGEVERGRESERNVYFPKKIPFHIESQAHKKGPCAQKSNDIKSKACEYNKKIIHQSIPEKHTYTKNNAITSSDEVCRKVKNVQR